MDKKTAQQLIESTFNDSFSEEQFMLFAKNLLNDLEPKSNFYTGNLIWDDYKEHINTYKRIGKYIDPEGEALDVLIVEVKSVTKLERARTVLRNFVIKHLSKFEKAYALVAFYSKEDEGADWRFSFVKLEYRSELDEEKGKVKLKKEFTPAKRYSFLVGKYEKAYTAKNQLLPLLQNIANNPTMEELEAAFSIEKVTDEFFNQYKDLYIKLYEHFENDSRVKTAIVTAGIDNARFTKKLLGQIVFLYFLQKKGWLGVAQNERWGTGKKRFVQELYEQAHAEGVNFFKDKLQYLFYEALAKERDNKNSYYPPFECRIPFLNGGLFDADYVWQNSNITIPENLFRNEEKNKSGDVGTGVLDVFDRYNFTIKEDEPLDKEVAVDPEMLGKVFENMLEISERKSKGAFYTPREIVHYMCQECLIHYLDNALNDEQTTFQPLDSDQLRLFGESTNKKGNLTLELEHKGGILVPKTDIETFIREGHFALENDQRVATKGETKTYQYQLPESIRQNADLIDQKLSNIRICDPAIGSGAFPVGLLHELVNAMLVLKPHFSYNYLTQKLEKFEIQHRESVSDSRYIYRLKRHIIQESIYGVDIDASAIDIARLRLWLSLVVDEDDLDPIETLPNLDYKIVCGNSLIGLPAQGADRYPQLKDELEGLKKDFFKETDEIEKKRLKDLINEKISHVLNTASNFEGYKIDFDFELFFSEVRREKGGFDIVIANPPYISNWSQSKNNREEVLLLDKLYKDFLTGHWDIFLCFIPKAITILRGQGICSFILPTSFYKEKHSTKVRDFFLNHLSVLELLDFEDEVIFSDVARQTGIFIVQKAKSTSGFAKIKNGINQHHRLVKQSFFKELKNSAFKLSVTDIDIRLYNKINYGSLKLGRYVCINTGVVAHSRAGSPVSFKKDDVIYKSFEEGYKKYIIGSNVSRFKITYENDYIDYDSKVDYFHRPKYKLLFESPKIIVRRISGKNNTLMACFDENKYYTNDNLMHVIHWSNEVLRFQSPEKKWSIVMGSHLSLKYILSVMTSEVFTYYFSMFLSTDTLQGSYSSIYPEDLREVPLKDIESNKQESFILLADYLLFLNSFKDELVAKQYFDVLLNGLIYELYFFEEIKLAGKEILKHLKELKPINNKMSEEEKLATIQSEFERLYDPNHPVRFALETLDSVEEVRIIKEALKN